MSHDVKEQGEVQEKKSKGMLLKEERQQQGLSLESIHEATKIPMDALRAIEEGYTIRTLSSFYVRGFLKIYAQYLNVDISEVVEDYQPQQVVPKENVAKSFNQFDLQKWLDQNLTLQRKQQLVALVGLFVVLFLVVKIVGFFKSRSSNIKTTQSKVLKPSESRKEAMAKLEAAKRKKLLEAQIQAKAAEQKIATQSVAAVTPTATTSSAKVTQVIKKKVVLTVRPLKDSWLRVRVDGETVYQSTLKRGSVETWQAGERVSLSGRNINQLEFELNGKMIGPLGRKNRRAKEVIFTKDGLTVR